MSAPTYIQCAPAAEQPSVAVLALSRPDRANAIIPAMAEQLKDALEDLARDEGVQAIVLTGSGKHFCPGMDGDHAIGMVESISRGEPPSEPFDGNLRFLHAATLALHHADKPIVAALNGSAAAGGLDLALACDYRIAVATAMFAESYVKLALPPLNGGAWLLPRVIGRSQAARMLLTGERVDVETALAMGLIDEVSAPETLLQRAVEVAHRMSRAPAALTRFLKRELRNDGPLESALSRAYVEGVTSLASESCRLAIEKLRR